MPCSTAMGHLPNMSVVPRRAGPVSSADYGSASLGATVGFLCAPKDTLQTETLASASLACGVEMAGDCRVRALSAMRDLIFRLTTHWPLNLRLLADNLLPIPALNAYYRATN